MVEHTAQDGVQVATYSVVVNREGQYSIWPIDTKPPHGWSETGVCGAKSECLSHIDTVWKDMRPNSLRMRDSA